MNNKKIISIVYVRTLAALMIFICHLLYISGSFNISMWFNTGVPLFFIISAYLISKRKFNKETLAVFYIKRIKSIFIPYEIYLLAIVLALYIINKPPSIKGILMYSLGLAGFAKEGVLGLGHFWYITVLLICYLIAPIILNICREKNNYKQGIFLCLIITAQFLLFLTWKYPAYGIHVGTYIFSLCYFFKRNEKNKKYELKLWIILAILISIIRLILDPIFMEMEYNIYFMYDSLFQPTSRFILAMAIFLIFVYSEGSINILKKKYKKIDLIIRNFSESSYEFYLTHQFIQLAFWEFIPFFHQGIGILCWCLISIVFTEINAFVLFKLKKSINYN